MQNQLFASRLFCLLVLGLFIGGSALADEPYLVKDLVTGLTPAGSSPAGFFKFGSHIYFTARTEELGTELWRTDGTLDGTVLVRDINPGTASSTPEGLVAAGGVLFFIADDTLTGKELWKTDGTTAGTVLVADLNTTRVSENIAGSSSPRGLVECNGQLYFSANDGSSSKFYRCDPSTLAITVVRSDFAPSEVVVYNGKMHFAGPDPQSSGSEFWESDGTTAGTALLANLNLRPRSPSGTWSSNPNNFVVTGGKLFFSANGSVDVSGVLRDDHEIYVYDGNSVTRVDVRPGADISNADSEPDGLRAFGNKVVFTGRQALNTGFAVYITDGTTAGTSRLADTRQFSNASDHQFTTVGSTLFFRVTNASNVSQLMQSDGTPAGTAVVDLAASSASSPAGLAALNANTLLFTAFTSSAGRELWKQTVGNTPALLKELRAGSSSGIETNTALTVIDGLAYFAGHNSEGPPPSSIRTEPWRSDGTANGTSQFAFINQDQLSGFPSMMTRIGDKMLVVEHRFPGNPSGRLWVADESTSGDGATLVFEFPNSSEVLALVSAGSFAYVCTRNLNEGRYELWKSDGTPAGTVQISSQIMAFSFGNSSPPPGEFTMLGNTLFYTASTSINGEFKGRELWKSDGTLAGTVMVKDINPEDESSNPANLTVLGNTLYFSANDGVNGVELWKTNGTEAGTVMVTNLAAQGASSNPADLRVMSGTLYFTAVQFVQRELFKTNGTSGGTVMVATLSPPGSGSVSPFLTGVRNPFVVLGKNQFFAARSDLTAGFELWKTDGMAAGTALVKDINPTPGASSSPRQFAVIRDEVFFLADDGVHGLELWKSDGTPAGTQLVKDIRPGPIGSFHQPTVISTGAQLFFAANDGVTGFKLWRSDGTTAGTQPVLSGVNPSNPENFALGRNRLFFSATTAATGQELFAIPVTIPVDDNRAPTQRITSKGGRVKVGSYDLAGVATDNLEVATVRVSVNGGPPVSTVLGAPDSRGGIPFTLVGISLENGLNSLTVTTVDRNGNVSKPTTLSVTFESNRPAIAGSYQGLLLPDPAAAASNDTTGLFTAHITAAGLFTGRVALGSQTFPVSGVIDNAGHARFRVKGVKITTDFPQQLALTKTIKRVVTPFGTLRFEVDGGLVEGSLRHTATDAPLSVVAAVRAHFNGKTVKLPDSVLATKGRYTATLPAAPSQPGLTAADYPQGSGLATASLVKSGRVTLRGVLADGTRFASSAPLSETLDWPFFARLYAKGGAVAGWLSLDEAQADTDFKGDSLLWLRPENLKAKHYQAGWPAGITVDIKGAKFARPADASVLPGLGLDDLVTDGNALLRMSQGLLTVVQERTLNIDSRNRVVNVPANREFQVKINSITGQLSGYFTHEDGTRTPWQGVIHQKGALTGGAGFFLSTVLRNAPPGQSGRITLTTQ